MANETCLNRAEPVGHLTRVSLRACLSERWLIAALALLLVSAASNRWFASWVTQLPADYSNEIKFSEDNRFRDTSTAEWQTSTFNVTRIDHTITSNGPVRMIEGSVHAYFTSGEVNFETVGLYGVDQSTRANLSGFGDSQRSGQYLFPAHVKPGGYTLWDPIYIGPRQATFTQSAVLNGLPVYVFEITASGLDETPSYAYLPEVPERFQAYTDTVGTAWVEPLSGLVVDYEDQGFSYFVDPATGKRVGDFNVWIERYTLQTQEEQFNIARETRLKILGLEIWLPLVLLACGLASLARAGHKLVHCQPGARLPGEPE